MPGQKLAERELAMMSPARMEPQQQRLMLLMLELNHLRRVFSAHCRLGKLQRFRPKISDSSSPSLERMCQNEMAAVPDSAPCSDVVSAALLPL